MNDYKAKVLEEAYQKFSPGYIGWATPLSLQKEFADFLTRALDGQIEAIREKIKGKQYNHGRLHGTIDCEPCAYANILTDVIPNPSKE